MTPLPAPRTFSCSKGSAQIYDHGAHVVSWAPTGAEPVLWMSAASAFDSDHPIRGGVPICFPWFGPGRSKDLSPVHGFARVTSWRFQSVTESADSIRAIYELTSSDVTSEHFPYAFAATYEVNVGEVLELLLTVTNTGDETFSFEEALHTYLAVGDSRQVVIDGLNGASYVDKAPGGGPDLVSQDGPVRITGETDRVYLSTAEVRVTDPVLERTLTINKSGSANTVVWNPWVAKSAAMHDFGDDEWTSMLCVEAANALENAVVLLPGASHTLAYRLSVS